MFGFPPILDGNAGIKFTRDADSGFPKPGIREIFYSVKDGNWTDPNTWQTASGRVGILPSANDDVYVRNVVTLNTTVTLSCNNLYVSGTLNNNQNLTLIVNNVFCDTGLLDFSSAQAMILSILGNNSRVGYSNILFGGSNDITQYAGGEGQPLMNLPYTSLIIAGTGAKYLTSNIILTGNLTISSILECLFYNLTVLGSTQINPAGLLQKSNDGNILFVGLVNYAGIVTGINLTGNPSVECRGGLSSLRGFTGTGTWSFTTNNQTILGNGFVTTLDCIISIASGITLTIGNTSNPNVVVNNVINGVDGTSVLRMGNGGNLTFATAASVPSMTTGIWDFTTNANTIGYTGNYSATIPSYFDTFRNLTIGGTGTKTTGANVTANGNVSIGSNANLTLGGNLSITGNLTLTGIIGTQNSCFLECGNFNLSVTGTTTGTGGCSLTKTGAGSLLFIGAFSFGSLFSRLLFTGNPTVEFRNGFAFAGGGVGSLASDCGTGLWSFTTNSQTLNLSSAGTFTLKNVQIVGNITVTYSNPTGNCILTIDGNINGTTAGSTFVHAVGTSATTANSLRITSAATTIMSTGVFDITTNNNLLIYDSTTPITIPYSTFRNLQILGAGTKTLGSNTTIINNLIVSVGGSGTGAIFDCSTFNLTVNGTTTVTTGGNFLKSGAGNIIFNDTLLVNAFNFTFNLSGGNPTVELKNGILATASGTLFNTGTGQWTFSTASQAIASNANNVSLTFNCPILISGANTLTIGGANTGFNVTMTGVLDGNNAASTLRTGASSPTLNYQNTTQPMATGVLDTSTNLNTFIYGAGNQQVKGNPTAGQFQQYRNLTLNGGGNKTLQGNINVQNTYTVTPPAALVLNGFTKTP